ncbi:CLUMA_CG006767, isoform A [Clunio marinus]|uniref:CLUMA_CG006767, isoform A n=1 Tax=Clunio marinus TaxID=568069 RepID=A0A1J1HYP8_9DIPT|nr:CLUMA_CG006767, isoform A [Clunio marinus]
MQRFCLSRILRKKKDCKIIFDCKLTESILKTKGKQQEAKRQTFNPFGNCLLISPLNLSLVKISHNTHKSRATGKCAEALNSLNNFRLFSLFLDMNQTSYGAGLPAFIKESFAFEFEGTSEIVFLLLTKSIENS